MKKLLLLIMLALLATSAFAQITPELLKKAEAGDFDAQYTIGAMYYLGKGVQQDKQKAVEWLKKANVNLEKSVEGVMRTYPPFLVNLADAGGKAYLRVVLSARIIYTPELVDNEAAIKEAIILILSSKKSDQLLTKESKLQLKQELLEKLNKIQPISDIYITEFIIQK